MKNLPPPSPLYEWEGGSGYDELLFLLVCLHFIFFNINLINIWFLFKCALTRRIKWCQYYRSIVFCGTINWVTLSGYLEKNLNVKSSHNLSLVYIEEFFINFRRSTWGFIKKIHCKFILIYYMQPFHKSHQSFSAFMQIAAVFWILWLSVQFSCCNEDKYQNLLLLLIFANLPHWVSNIAWKFSSYFTKRSSHICFRFLNVSIKFQMVVF